MFFIKENHVWLWYWCCSYQKYQKNLRIIQNFWCWTMLKNPSLWSAQKYRSRFPYCVGQSTNSTHRSQLFCFVSLFSQEDHLYWKYTRDATLPLLSSTSVLAFLIWSVVNGWKRTKSNKLVINLWNKNDKC